jgi:hypothetical protein
MEVDKFFMESEQSLHRILELLFEIGKAMFRIFDPDSIDAFADIIEAMLPAIEQVAETFGAISRFFAWMLENPVIKLIFQTGFGLLIFDRIGTKFLGLFSSVRASILGVFQLLTRSAATLTAMTTTTGGLVTRVQAATAAWKAYGAAAATAQTQAARGAVAGGAVGGARGRTGPQIDPRTGAVVGGAAYGRNPAIFGPMPVGPTVDDRGRVRNTQTGRFMPQALAPYATRAGEGAQRGAAAIRSIFGGAGALAGGLIIGTLAINAINNYNRVPSDSTLTSRQQRLAERSRGPLEDILGQQAGSIREAIQPGFFDQMFDFGSPSRTSQIAENLFNVEKRIRALHKAGDEQGLARLARQLRGFAEELGGDKGKLLDDLADSVEKLNSKVREGGIKADDILSRSALNEAKSRMTELAAGPGDRVRGFTWAETVKFQMGETMKFINASVKKGSESWKVLISENMSSGISALIDNLKKGRGSAKENFEEIARITRRQMRFVRNNMDNLSADGRDALSNNFRTARIRAERQLGRLETATGESLRVLKRLMAAELASYGFTSQEVRSIIRAKRNREDVLGGVGSRTTEGTSQGPQFENDATGGWVGRPMGGFIGAMGERGQDAIRTMLGRGEAVLNWGQQRLVEPALNAAYGFGLDQLFKKTKGWHAGTGTTGMARGGRIPIVPVPGFPGELANRAILDEIKYVTQKFGLRLTDAYGPGHQSPGHTIYGTAADFAGPDRAMNAAVKFLANKYKVLYDGRFGSMAWPGHGPSTVAGGNAHLHVEFGTKDLGAAAGNFGAFNIPRVEITGAGPMGDIATTVVGKVRLAALRKARAAIRRSMGAGVEGAEMGAGAAPPGQLRNWLRRALSITNLLTPGNLNALYGRAMQESGGDPRAQNNWDSNAAAGTPSMGLLQTIRPTFDAYKMRGMGNIWNPIHNAVAAIRYMMARYGHIVGPSSTGYASGGELPGPLGAMKMIMAHGKEWILNEGQKGKIAGWLGTSVSNLRDKLGFTGGPTSAQGGGDTEKFRPIFDQQDFLGNRLQPLDFRGLARVVVELFQHMQEVRKKGERTFKNVNENLDQLTREGGLLDQIDVAIERAIENMATKAAFIRFQRGGTVVSNRGEAFEARSELNQLRRTGRLLNRQNRFVGRALGAVGDQIRGIRRGGVDEDEEADLQDLLTQQRNLTERRRNIRGRLGENLRARFEAQQRVIETALERDLRGSNRDLRSNELAQRIAQAFGRGGGVNFIDTQISLLNAQIPIIQAAMEKAKAQGNTALVDQLQDQIGDIDAQINELVAQRMQTQIDEVEKRFGRAEAGLGLRERLLTALGKVGLGGGMGGILAERGALMAQKRDELIALRAQATLEGNTGAVETLTDQIEELGVQIVENTAAIFQARIEDVNRAQQTAGNLSATRSRIIELQRELGIITPEQAQGLLSQQLQIQRDALIQQQAGLQQLLNEAIAAGNDAAITDLTQQMADNELALLENTMAVKELDGSLNETQSFSTTAWQWYRTAIFNGSGGLLENFTPPIGLTGVPTPAYSGTWGAGGGGESSYTAGSPTINNYITQNETVDFMALSNKIAWDINTPGV